MSLYDGFFDAVKDETTGEYDRSYSSDSFTGYFSNVIGSGVCVHNNPDSFKAEYEDGTLYLQPGYLFIQGYWLANKAGEGESNYKGYAVTLPTGMTGPMAVVAHLNLGQRLIEIKVQAVSQAYPDALVLAIITPDTAEDTRHNTAICGVIDTAGELSSKVEWALNYIDTEINSKLQQVEVDIAAQDAKLDAKISEVQAVADSIVPPPVGTIKFSAAQDVGPEWLQCNGDFISESQYPELVAALGKLTPSGDKFQLISSGEIGPQISNGVVYGGRMWVYSYSTKKLYGVDVVGTTAIKEVALTSEDPAFNSWHSPTKLEPIALSITPPVSENGPAYLFLAQTIGGDISANPPGSSSGYNPNFLNSSNFLIFSAEFTGSETSLSMAYQFSQVEYTGKKTLRGDKGYSIPYVVSQNVEGTETFYCMPYGGRINDTSTVSFYLTWTAESQKATANILAFWDSGGNSSQILSFNKKNKNELVYSFTSLLTGGDYYSFGIDSIPNSIFHRDGVRLYRQQQNDLMEETQTTTPIIGGIDFITQAIINSAGLRKIPRNEIKTVSSVPFGIQNLPSAKRTFLDATVYLWGKDIYMIFVGTGVIFSRTLEEGSFGYLDTTSVLGTITQFGYLDYSQDEGALYLLGQDTTNTVKVAKIVFNTLYDYANDGAWLPMIAADGVPAWIKAKEAEA